MTQKFDIITIGSLTVDLFLQSNIDIESLPTAHKQEDFFVIPVGEKIRLYNSFQLSGGGAANVGIASTKLKLNTGAIGTMGNDDNSNFILRELKSNNVNTDYLIQEKGKTSSFSIILMGKDGRRTVIHERIQTQNIRNDFLHSLPETRAIYIGHLYEDSASLLENIPEYKAQHPNTLIGWNPGKTQFKEGLDHFQSILPHIDVLVLNVEEAGELVDMKAKKMSPVDFLEQTSATSIREMPSHHPDIHDTASLGAALLETGAKCIVITDGKRGSHGFCAQEGYFYLPSSMAKAVNTLGAGDAFSAGVMAAKLYGHDIGTQMLWGDANATGVISKFGAQAGQLTYDEINQA